MSEPAAKRQRPAVKRRTTMVPKRRVVYNTVPRPLWPVPASGDGIHTFSRTFRGLNSLIPTTLCADNGGYQAAYAMTFQMSDLPNYAEYSALFDMYRILKAELVFEPRYTSNVDGTSDNHLAYLGWFVDHNGVDMTGFSGNENPWLEHEGYRQVLFDKETRMSLTPRVSQSVYKSSIASGYQTQDMAGKPSWIQFTAGEAIPHYGLYIRAYVPGLSAPGGYNLGNYYVRLTFQCRGSR